MQTSRAVPSALGAHHHCTVGMRAPAGPQAVYQFSQAGLHLLCTQPPCTVGQQALGRGFGCVQQLAGVRPTAFMQDGAAGPERAYHVALSHCTRLSTVLINIRMLQALSKHCTQQKWQLSSLQLKPRPPPTSLISICYIKCNADSCPTSTEPTQKDQA